MSCPDCISGNPLPGSPKGTEENGAYFAQGSGQEETKDKAVVVLTDIFGIAIPNPKIIADTIADRTGFDVWVPDLFNGLSFASIRRPDVRRSSGTDCPGHPPLAPEVMDPVSPRHPGEKIGFLKTVKFYLAVLMHIPGLIASRPAVVDKRAKEVCSSVTRPAC